MDPIGIVFTEAELHKYGCIFDIHEGESLTILSDKFADSYYVCNRKPGDGLIAPLRSIVFFRIEKRDEPLRYASRTLASLNAMKGGSGKKKSKKLAR